MTPQEIECRKVRPGNLLTKNGATVTAATYDSARNAYRIEYQTGKGQSGAMTIPANDLVVIWK